MTLEELSRSCVLEFDEPWLKVLFMVEYTIGVAPFEALYGRKCKTPLFWDREGERLLTGPQIVQETTSRVRVIRAHNQHKLYADGKPREVSFK